MARFHNTDGTLLTLGAVAVLGVAAAVSRRGSRNDDEPEMVSVAGLRNAPLFTDAYVRDAEIETLAENVTDAYDGWIYLPTDDELGALEYLSTRYSSAEYLYSCVQQIPVLPKTLANAHETQTAVVMGDPDKLKEALWGDGSDRVPMLADSSSLQRLVWLTAPSDSERRRYALEEVLKQHGYPHLYALVGDDPVLIERIEDAQYPWNGEAEEVVEDLIAEFGPAQLQG